LLNYFLNNPCGESVQLILQDSYSLASSSSLLLSIEEKLVGGIYIFSIEIPFEELSPEEQRRVMKIKKRLKELEKNKELMEFIEREREKRMRELIEGFKK